MTPDVSRGATRCAVLGSPISHSLSPTLHRAAYAWLGLTGWTYDACEVRDDGLADFVAGLDSSWRGLSLTMPLKHTAMALGTPDHFARVVGVANTIVLGASGHQVANTDVPGLVAALHRAGVDRVESVVILGAGATARSALVSAAELGARAATVLARRPEQAAGLRELADRCGVSLRIEGWGEPVPTSDLLLSTVTAGAADARVEAYAASAPVIFDAIYAPWPTMLTTIAEQRGRTVVNGLDLLVGQAVLQLDLMTGHSVPPEILYAAGLAALSAHSSERSDPRPGMEER